MTHIYLDANSPWMDDEISQQIQRHNQAEAEFRAIEKQHREADRASAARLDELLLRKGPAYPTPEQLNGLALVSEYTLRPETVPTEHRGDHLGATIAPGLAWDWRTQRINVKALAPYSSTPALSTHLWELAPDEIEHMRSILRDHGLSIMSEWDHDDGHAFIVKPKDS